MLNDIYAREPSVNHQPGTLENEWLAYLGQSPVLMFVGRSVWGHFFWGFFSTDGWLGEENMLVFFPNSIPFKGRHLE